MPSYSRKVPGPTSITELCERSVFSCSQSPTGVFRALRPECSLPGVAGVETLEKRQTVLLQHWGGWMPLFSTSVHGTYVLLIGREMVVCSNRTGVVALTDY